MTYNYKSPSPDYGLQLFNESWWKNKAIPNLIIWTNNSIYNYEIIF